MAQLIPDRWLTPHRNGGSAAPEYSKNIGTDSNQALLLDFQATLETKPEKAIKLEKDALAQIETITADNARLASISALLYELIF